MSNDERHEEELDHPRIKVTDRRMFDREGNPRDPDPEPATSSAPPMPELDAAGSAPGVQAATPQPEAPRPQPESPTPARQRPAASGSSTSGGKAIQATPEAFLQFLEEQYMMGMIALGAMPHPQTGEPAEDLDMAQLRIEMLESLDERTKSTRGPEESQVIEDALYRMRMVYLQKRKIPKL